MQLAIKPVAGVAFQEFCDEASRTDTLELFQPDFARAVQVVPIFRATTPELFDRGNAVVAVSVICTRTYANRALALASLAALTALFIEKFHLRLTQDGTIHYYPNAVANGYTPALIGTTIRHVLKFTSQNLTTTEPS